MGLTLYRASAGSGKTYTLVKEYLKIVLKDPQKYKNILAITFTNKAATEMKDRILEALQTLSLKKNQDLEQVLSKELEKKVNLAEQASEVLSLILHHYSDFAVTTIDSFMFRVISTFALELGLPLSFKVDLTYRQINAFIVEKIMADVGIDPYVTDVVLQFVFSKLYQNQSWNIESDMIDFEDQIFNEKNIRWIERIAEFDQSNYLSFVQELSDVRAKFLDALKMLGQQGYQMLVSAALDIKKNSAAAYLKKLSDISIKDLAKLDPYQKFKNNAWYAKGEKEEIKTKFERILREGLSEIRNSILKLINDDFPRALSTQFLLNNVYLLAIVYQIKKAIEDYKRIFQIIPISEFNQMVNRVVRHSPAPFIYAFLGETYFHYLIDECQDTNRLQWENLYPLIEDSLAYDALNLAVGDGKQSIYRWRGSHVGILESEIEERFSNDQVQIKSLKKNFRSRKNVVDFNNRFFKNMIADLGQKYPLLRKIFVDVEQDPVSAGGGSICLDFFDADQEEMDRLVSERTKEIIKDARHRGYQYSDIGVLVRTKKDGAIIASALLKQGIPVISSDTLNLAEALVIQFIITLLGYMVNPQDRIIEATLIYILGRYCNRGRNEVDLMEAYFLSGNRSLLNNQLAEFFNRQSFLNRLPLYELIEEIVRIFKFQAGNFHKNSAYILKFLNVVASYSKENNDDISSFLKWWEFKKDELLIEVPAKKNAVKLMTFHKAKGLEFPIVILPYANWEFKMDHKLWLQLPPGSFSNPVSKIPLLVNRNNELPRSLFKTAYVAERERMWLDNVNLLYVACTRAIDSLFVMVNGGMTSPKKSNSGYLFYQYGKPLIPADDAAGGRYIYGQFVSSTRRQKKAVVEFKELDMTVTSPWYSKMTIRREAKGFWRFGVSQRAESARRGILIHRLLADIKDYRDVEPTIEKHTLIGQIPVNERAAVSHSLRNMFAQSMVRDWFKPGQEAYSEHAIITAQEIIRPDRVIFDDNSIIVVDFKTGGKEKEHIKQIKKYTNAIQAMGFSKVQGFLYYIEQMIPMKV